MSLILDALRKMEQERRSRRGAANDLRPEVLRYRMATQAKEPAKYPVVLIGAVLLCLGVGAGVLLKGNRNEAPREEMAVSAVAPSPQPAPAAPLPAAPAVAPLPQPAAVTAPAPSLPESVSPSAAAAVRPKSAPASSRPAAEGEGSSPREAAAVQAGAPDISISGIAYQDERRMRRAVLNGVLVGEGAEIAGARVVEIKETKVRLSRGGQIFELPFSSGH